MKKNSIDFLKFLAFVIIIIIVFLSLLNNIANFDLLILIMLFLLFFVIYLKKPYFIVKYIFSIFYCLYMLLGLFICNNIPLYLGEMEAFSTNNGSFSVCVLYWLVFLMFLVYYDKKYSHKLSYYLSTEYLEDKFNKIIDKVIYPILFIVGLIMFASVFKNPAFKYNYDRFIYSKKLLPGWISSLQGIYTYLVPLLLCPIITKNKKIYLYDIIKILFTIFPFILTEVWVGNKFGPFFNILILVLPPLIIYIIKKPLNLNSISNLEISSKNDFIIKKYIKKILFFSVILIFSILIPYYGLRNYNALDSIYERTAMQGELWWSLYGEDKNGTPHLEELNDEIIPIAERIKSKEITKNYGVYKVMKKTISNNRYYYVVYQKGYRYSAQGIDIAYYYFGYFGIIIHAIIRACITSLMVNLLIKYILSHRYIESFIMSYFSITFNGIFTQGDIHNLFSPMSILLIIILIISCLLYNKNSYSKKGKLYE